MFECDLMLVSCRPYTRKDGTSSCILQTEDMDDHTVRYQDFGKKFSILQNYEYGTVLRCQMYNQLDHKSGKRISVINDFEIFVKGEL